eukprot:TRINITY_DN560_c0_g1_i1.p1 TRINITY_DN560_c0_g1~~TRINITY_DN560_c0_g1_i1.p1  ORF type:complete len:151 (+),score=29.31 TRINITY_DN560_c0_g1_i1:547-999(+)
MTTVKPMTLMVSQHRRQQRRARVTRSRNKGKERADADGGAGGDAGVGGGGGASGGGSAPLGTSPAVGGRAARMHYKARGFGFAAKEDHRAYDTAIDRCLKEDIEPSAAIKDATKTLTNLLLMKNLEPEAISYLLRVGVPNFVRSLLTRSK